MWPTWWWPQALMQPQILIFSSPSRAGASGSAKRSAMLLGDRDRARVGERAVVEARAGDDVGDQVDVGVARPAAVQRRVDRRQIVDFDVRQDQVLLVA